jgi:hypothetical protein
LTTARGSSGPPVRVGLGTLGLLALCAAAGAAALAHYVIDIVGDYALPHDTYDDVIHSSRGLVSGIALVLAIVLASRGLRVCCELAASCRGRLRTRTLDPKASMAFALISTIATACFVPAMECLDGRLAGAPITTLGDAFGGSLALGLGLTLLCAAAIGALVYAIARWLISYRDAIATIIGTLLRRSSGAPRLCGRDFWRQVLTPRRRRTPHALRLCKRGPPSGGLNHGHHFLQSTEGDSREFCFYSRYAGVNRARDNANFRRPSMRGATAYCAPR